MLPPAPNGLRGHLSRLFADSGGGTVIEYAMIAGGIAVAIVGALAIASGNLQRVYDRIAALF